MSVPQGWTISLSQHYFPSLKDGKYNLRFCQVIAALRLKSLACTEGLTVSSLNCDRWLILGLEAFSH